MRPHYPLGKSNKRPKIKVTLRYMSEIREEDILKEAIDHVDTAIDLLRELAKRKKSLAESLEDIIYHLEEAGELLSSLSIR